MIGRVDIQVPYKFNIIGLSFYRDRQAGFAFTNQATLILAQNVGIELQEVPKWAKENQTLYFIESLFAAYIAYCQENYKKPVFDKKRLSEGFTHLSEEDQKKIVRVWNEALTTGAKPIPSKKKR